MSQPDPSMLVITERDRHGVLTVTLNRPQRANAYNGDLIDALRTLIAGVHENPGDARVLVIRGRGPHFQGGADLHWVSTIRAAGSLASLESSRAAAQMISDLNTLPIPVVGVVQGACYGGGTGILAACDVVIAAEDAKFSIAEVRWGLTPGFILPQLNDAMSVRQVRRYALTAEQFDVREAWRLGLVHEIVPRAELDARVETVVSDLLANAPGAMAATKRIFLSASHGGKESEDALEALSRTHTAVRLSAEAAEGLAAFEQRRAPRWPQDTR